MLAGEGAFAVGDVRILEAREVHEEFNPRFDAKGKKYIYKIRNTPQPAVLQRNYSYQIHKPLNLEAMKQAAAYLIGEHDFRCFMAAGGNVPESTIRTIYSIEWKQRFLEESGNSPAEDAGDLSSGGIEFAGSCIEFEIRGNGFLYNMVRIIAGTLVDIGLGRIAPEEMKAIIESKDRQRAGHTAPPGGLYLAKVYFDEEDLKL